MKKILLILALCSGLFANELCSVATEKIGRLYDSMILDIRNNDIDSLSMNFISFKVWIDTGIMNCDKDVVQVLFDAKRDVYPSVQEVLNGK